MHAWSYKGETDIMFLWFDWNQLFGIHVRGQYI